MIEVTNILLNVFMKISILVESIFEPLEIMVG